MKIAGMLGISFVMVLLAMALLTSDAPCQFVENDVGGRRMSEWPYKGYLIDDRYWEGRVRESWIFAQPHAGPSLGDQFGQGGARWNEMFAPPCAGLFPDNAPPSASRVPPVASPRFTITLVREKAVLLDSVTGETWILVFTESGRTPAYWQPIPRRDAGTFRKD
jgi:hypothetical protein